MSRLGLEERAQQQLDGDAPTPLPPELPEVAPFPIDAMPDALRPWCADVAERMQCPPDFVAVPMLVAAASLAARHVAIRPQARTDWTERANLWALIVGRPGVMKSPALAQALAPMEHMERCVRKAYAEQMTAFEADARTDKLRADVAESEAKKRLRKNLDADLSGLLAAAEEPLPPPRARFQVNDVTYEALGEVLAQNPGGVLSVRDEMKSLLADLSKEEKANARGFFVQAWSGGSYAFDRIMRGSIYIEDARLSMIGGIQPGPLGELVRQAQGLGSGADGLLERFLIAWPDDPGGWREVDRWPDSKAREQCFETFDALAALTPQSIGAQRDENRAGEAYGPHYLRFEESAREMFAEWRADLEKKLRGDDAEGVESALSKFRHHVPALALTLHLSDGGSGPVGELAALRALALGEYFESHARRCFSSSRRCIVRAAKTIMAKISSGGLGEAFTARDVHQKGWSGLTAARTVTDALDMLAAHGWLLEGETQTGGRPKVIYFPRGGGRP